MRYGISVGAVLAVLVAVSGCGFFSDPGERRFVVQFRVPTDTLTGEAVVEGESGELRLEDLYLLVGDFRLVRAGAACPSGAGPSDGCVPLGIPPRVIHLPFGMLSADTTIVVAAVASVPEGRYDALAFSTFDPVDTTRTGAEHLAAEMRRDYPEWPGDANLLFVGGLLSESGTTRTFAAYADADTDVRVAIVPPIDAGGADGNDVLAVHLDLSRWLLEPDGRLVDLPRYDATTGRLLDLEDRLADAFVNAGRVVVD